MQHLDDGELVSPAAEAAAVRAVARTARRPTRRRHWGGGLLALAVFAAITLAVEAAVRLLGVKAYVFPPPSAVLAELAQEPGLFASNAMVTLREAFAGLGLGAALALGFAVAALHSQLLDRVLTPLVVASQTIPVIALAPLLVLWFGYGDLPRVIVCALIAFFPMAVTALQGLRATDPQLLLLMRSVGARGWDVFWRVRVPAAAPFLAAGLRTAVTLSLVGAVVAEWTGTTAGLGYLVLSANARMATAQAFAAVVTITMLGLVAYGGAVLLERKLCWWNRPDGAGAGPTEKGLA